MPGSRIALYSAITGHYERRSEILPGTVAAGLSEDVDLFRFTDSAANASGGSGKSGGPSRWQEERVSPRLPMDPIRSARAIKILGDSVLSDYDVTMWVDNRIQLKVSPEELVHRFLPDNADFALPLHSFHGSLEVEFAKVIELFLDDPRRVREQRSAYRDAVPGLLSRPVFWTAILIRRNNDAVRAFNALWWEQVLRYSRRDQLSFPYVAEMMRGVNIAAFPLDNFSSEFHQWLPPADLDRLVS